MTDIAFDVETYEERNGKYYPVLDATGEKFLIGSITNEKGKSEIFKDKKAMWNDILRRGEKARKHGHCLYAYAHAIKYDFFTLFEPQKDLVVLSEFPFIAIYYVTKMKEIHIDKWERYKKFLDVAKKRYNYKIVGTRVLLNIKQEAVRFVDTFSIFRMSLKKIGEMVGLEKLELPKSLKKKDLNSDKIKEYVIRDTEILIKAIKMLKGKLKKDGINVKRIVTANQIAIAYLLKLMKKQEVKGFFHNDTEKVVQGKARRKVRKAYRGGRVEAWKLGITKKASSIDNNCYSEDTEILTYKGFKKYTEIGIGDKVLTMNSKEELEYNEIKNIIINDYNGELYSFESENVDLKVTPNHRIYFYKREGFKCSGVTNNLYIREAKDIPLTYIKIPCARKYNQGIINNNKYLIKLLSWIITEGCYTKSGITISQSSQRNNEYANEIEECLKKLNISYHKSSKNKCINHDTCWEFYIRNKDALWIKEICHNKNIQQKWLNEWCQKDLCLMFWTLLKGDGSFRFQKKMTFVAKDKNVRDKFQELCLKIGKKSKNCDKHKVIYIKNNRDGNSTVTIRKNTKQYNYKRILNYKGKVWCVNVQNSNIIIRRNGKVCISGNSLYPSAAAQIRFPNLETEVFWNKPDKRNWNSLLNEIGVCRAIMYNKNNEIGLLPIRLPHLSYFPKVGKYMIGTWTNEEITEAVKEGYEIINIQFIITYEETENPFKQIMPDLYEKRKDESLGSFNNDFYKSVMNGGIGKFAQTKIGQEIVFDDSDMTLEYERNNYVSLGGIRDDSRTMKFKRGVKEFRYKSYYCPLIPALITAKARLIMYKIYKTIELNKLIYTDTDSCVFKGKVSTLPKSLKLGVNLGEFKVEFEGKEFKCWGRKSKSVDNELRISGVTKNDMRNYNEKTGILTYTKMQGLGKTNTGEFIKQTKDLKKQTQEYIKSEKILEEMKIYIDNTILKDVNREEGDGDGKDKDDITYFTGDLEKIDKQNI